MISELRALLLVPSYILFVLTGTLHGLWHVTEIFHHYDLQFSLLLVIW